MSIQSIKSALTNRRNLPTLIIISTMTAAFAGAFIPVSFALMLAILIAIGMSLLSIKMMRSDPSGLEPARVDIAKLDTPASAISQPSREIEELTLQLQEQRAVAKAATAELEEFAYIISHDLGESTRGIRYYCAILEQDYASQLDEEACDLLARSQGLCKRLDSMIAALLQYSRAGGQALNLNEIDIGVLVNRIIDEIEASGRFPQARIEVVAPLPTLVCDGMRANYIFHQLVENGLTFNDSTEKHIRIGCDEASGEAGKLYWFYVEDNGIGITPDHQAEVFKIFRRLHAREEYGSGIGAGLALVKRHVTKHGGTISVSSELGHGAKFVFSLQEKAIARMDGADV